ncbi:D-glycero-beta-D-manno-heptose 1,7-bisphosphate 7-phosphatase [Phascolarctobacterium sp.]|uniref:D-glycero-beta-D-manno-heptose 1,7-bisphosphate 7-phosphatase n=1 Tax=Phascolarctobacterium sp. TaxID=2049039 RepID=UPI00386518D4
MKAKAVFFDRDGVLNVDVAYLYKIEDLQWVEGAREAVAYLTRAGYKIFVVTNQSGIARGYYTVEQMQALHEHMQQEIAKMGGAIEKIYYCPHHKEGKVPAYTCDCSCRKPKPGMLLQAFAEYEIDKENSFLIGDSPRDVEAAEAAGIRGYLFKGGSLLNFVKELV